jgi:two-component system, OmpR family, response regulator
MKNEQLHLLIVDDDKEIREPLARYLHQHGFRTSLAANAKEVDQVLVSANIDLIVLDIMMPGEDGLSICNRLQSSVKVPIILLTALNEEADRIVGLELGADDYVNKPFNPRELLARIKSVIRRAQMLPRRKQQVSGTVRFDQWQFDLAVREVIGSDDVVIRLSSGEHALLVALVEHAGVTLTRDQLLDLTKGREAQLFDRSIDNQISRLRRKLEVDSKVPKIILTQWGGGYVLAAKVEWLE